MAGVVAHNHTALWHPLSDAGMAVAIPAYAQVFTSCNLVGVHRGIAVTGASMVR